MDVMEAYVNDLAPYESLKRRDAELILEQLHAAKAKCCPDFGCLKRTKSGKQKRCKICNIHYPKYLQARDKLVQSVLKWSVLVTKRIWLEHRSRGGSIPLADLISESNLELTRVIERWVPKNGNLTTFVTRCLYNHLGSMIIRGIDGHVVRLPLRVREQMAKAGDCFTVEEVIDKLDVPRYRAQEIRNAMMLYKRQGFSDARLKVGANGVKEPLDMGFDLKALLSRIPPSQADLIRKWMALPTNSMRGSGLGKTERVNRALRRLTDEIIRSKYPVVKTPEPPKATQQKEPQTVFCPVCGLPFLKPPTRQKYCSERCRRRKYEPEVKLAAEVA